MSLRLVAQHFELEDSSDDRPRYRCRFDRDEHGVWNANIWRVAEAPIALTITCTESDLRPTQANARRLIKAAIKQFGPTIEEPASA